MARFIEMFPTYLVIFLLGNVASVIWESVTKPPFGLSYVNKILTLRFLASDSVDHICGNTVDKTQFWMSPLSYYIQYIGNVCFIVRTVSRQKHLSTYLVKKKYCLKALIKQFISTISSELWQSLRKIKKLGFKLISFGNNS